MQRAAAKRRKAGAKNHSGIEQVRIFDYALAQARDRFIEVLQHQTVGEVIGCTARALRLDRPAIAPLVVAAPGLAAEVAGRE